MNQKVENDADFEGTEEGIEQDLIDLPNGLSDTGKFAYLGLCVISMNKLFSTIDWDQTFCQNCYKCLLEHLKLPQSVEPIMQLLLIGKMENTVESFLDILKGEDSLSGNMNYILQDLIAVAVQKGEYDARWRVLIRYIAGVLGAKFEDMELYEITVIHCLTRDRKVLTPAEEKAMKSRVRLMKIKRYSMIGLATVGVGALVGVTGGLAAPLITSGIASLIGSTTVISTLSAATGAAVIGTFFGAAGAGLAGYKMKKRVGEIEEFAFGQLFPSTSQIDNLAMVTTAQLDITIALSGWIKDKSEDNFTRPWQNLYMSREQYYLKYESNYLLELGRAMDYVMSITVSLASQEALKFTALSGLVSAVAWPTSLLGLASVIDNPWGVCCRRSAQVGKHLADVLINREHGRRPVTLIGYSLGARVIYYCLRELSERGESSTGIVQDAYLIGAPCSANIKEWEVICKVVAGKVTNAYCRTDWLLKFLYRTLSMPRGGVAGLQPIDITNDRLQNIDLSDIVSGHREYPEKMNEILKHLKVRIIENDKAEKLAASKSFELLTVDDDSVMPMSKSHSDSSLLRNDS